MNTTLPGPRDLPPHRHAEIRAELERAVTGRRRRAWRAPALTAAAVVVLVAFFAWPSPAPRDADRAPAGPSSAAPTSSGPAPPAVERPPPVVPGLSPARRVEIEKGCAKSVGERDATLYQLVEDDAGKSALLYTEDSSVSCDLDVPGTPYNAVGGDAFPLGWLPGPVSIDVNHASAGGDSSGNRGIYTGMPGLETAAGRITSDVARVTYTNHGVTTDAVLANGTYLVRVAHPTTWEIPDPPRLGVLRAFDAAGAFIGSLDVERWYTSMCARAPGGTIFPRETRADPSTCGAAVPWR